MVGHFESYRRLRLSLSQRELYFDSDVMPSRIYLCGLYGGLYWTVRYCSHYESRRIVIYLQNFAADPPLLSSFAQHCTLAITSWKLISSQRSMIIYWLSDGYC